MDGSVNSKGVGEANSVPGIMGFAVGDTAVAREIGVAIGVAIFVSTAVVLTVDMPVSIRAVGVFAGVDLKLLQDANVAATRKKVVNDLSKIFTFHLP